MIDYGQRLMARLIVILLVVLATGLIGRAARIHWQVWKAAESRKDLLAHFVDRTKTLTDRQIEEARFWSTYGDHSDKAFAWYLIGGLFAGAAADWLDRRTKRAKA